VNEAYIRRFLALASARKIPVFWLLPPVLEGIQSQREQNGLDARYAQLISRMQARFPGLTVLDGRHARYAVNVFFDPLHLDRRGAAVLSHDVGQMLERRLSERQGRAQTAWLELPKFRDGPWDAGLEDTTQTILALLSGQKERAR